MNSVGNQAGYYNMTFQGGKNKFIKKAVTKSVTQFPYTRHTPEQKAIKYIDKLMANVSSGKASCEEAIQKMITLINKK